MRIGGNSGGLLWLGVVWAFNDCVASLRICSSEDLPERSEREALTSPAESWRLLLVDKLSCRLFNFRRHDLVVLQSPEEPKRRLIRRLIGLEGDWVAVADAGQLERIPKVISVVMLTQCHATDTDPWLAGRLLG